jgi:hypothetical protein
LISNLSKYNTIHSFSNHKVIETGNGTLTVKGFITDAKTGTPIKGASLSFALDGNGTKVKAAKANELLVKKTAEKGGFIIK